MPVLLYVYGTLKRDSRGKRHPLLRDARFVTLASMLGTLYDLGPYPGVVPDSKTRRVFGELYEIPSIIAERSLDALDWYEGSDFIRRRVFVTMRDGRRRAAWAYLLRKRPPQSARHLESGRYSRRRGPP